MILAQTQNLIERLQLYDKKNREWIRFKLWPRQKEFHHLFLNKKRVIILKKRQIGASQMVGADSLLQCMLMSNFSTLILSKTGNQEGGDAKVFLDRIRQMYQKIPTLDQMWIDMQNSKKFHPDDVTLIMLKFHNPATQGADAGVAMKFVSGSYILSLPASKGRGMTADRVVIDEAAFVRPDPSNITLDTVFENVEPALDKTDGQLILISTANGLDLFAEIFNKALSGLNDYSAFFFSCFDDPTFTEQKREEIERTRGKKHVNQEYPRFPEEAFIASGSCRFDTEAIQKYQEQNKKYPITVRIKGDVLDRDIIVKNPLGDLEIYKKKKLRGQYFISGDVAEGLEHGDKSALKVYDRETWQMVACWHGTIEHAELGKIAARLGRIYNNAVIAIEANNHGHSALTALLHVEEYPEELVFCHGVLKREKEDDDFTGNMRFGWQTTNKTRPIIISNLADFIQKGIIPYFTDKDISELRTFIKKKGGKYEAEEGFCDDLVLTHAIGYFLLDNDTFNEHYKLCKFPNYNRCGNCRHSKWDSIMPICHKSRRRIQDNSICSLYEENDYTTPEVQIDISRDRSGYISMSR